MNINRLKRNEYKRKEFFTFLWYYHCNQILDYPQDKTSYIALLRFYKNFKRHNNPNSYFIKLLNKQEREEKTQ